MSGTAEALLLAKLGADISGFLNQFGKAADAADSFASKLVKVGVQLAATASAAAAAAVALGVKFGLATIDLIDAQDDLASRLQGTVNGLRALEIAGDRAGAGTGALTSAVEKLNKTIGLAKNGSEEAQAKLASLGLTADELANMDVDRRLAAVAGRLAELGFDAEQAQAKLNELGIRGAESLGLFTDGGAGIINASAALKKFGGALSDVDLRIAKQAKESMDNLSISMQGFRDKLAVALAPAIIAVTKRIQEIVAANGGWTEVISKFGEIALGVIGAVADGARGIQIVWLGLKATFATVAEGLLLVATATARVGQFVPGLKGFAVTALDLLQSTQDYAKSAREELAALANQPMPSDQLNHFMDSLRSGGGGGGAGATPQASGAAPGSEGLQNVSQAIRDAQASGEGESPADRRKRELEEFAAHNTTIQDLTQQHYDALAQITDRGEGMLTQLGNQWRGDALEDITSTGKKALAVMATNSRSAFNAQKAAAIAEAIINTYKGVSYSLSVYPMPYAAIAGAAHLAYGLAQVSAIKSQQFGGGSAGGAGSGGAAPPPPQAAAGGGGGGGAGGSLLILEGLSPDSLFSGKAVRELAQKLSDHVADGGQIRFN